MPKSEAVVQMRAEITTLEQFDNIGKYGRVAMKYGVSDATAYNYRRELEKRGKEVEQPTQAEREKFFEESQPELPTVQARPLPQFVDNKFAHVLAPIAELLQKKNTDYGQSYDQLRTEFGEVSFLIRLADKFNRLKTLVRQDAQVKTESIEDTINDIIGYCTLELVYRQNHAETR